MDNTTLDNRRNLYAALKQVSVDESRLNPDPATLVFVSPDFSGQDMHPGHYTLYYPDAATTLLPPDIEKAHQAILDRVSLATFGNKDIAPQPINGLVFGMHGAPDGGAIGGWEQGMESIAGMLGELRDIQSTNHGKPLAKYILFAACDVLGDASADYLDKLSKLAKDMKTPLLLSGPVSFVEAVNGKGFTPTSGEYFMIDSEGRFKPQPNFKPREKDFIALAQTTSAFHGHDSLLVEQRVILDSDHCQNNPSACQSAQERYEQLDRYGKAKLNVRDLPRGKASVSDLQTVSAMIPSLPPLYQHQALLSLIKQAEVGSPLQKQSIEQATLLANSGSESRYVGSDSYIHTKGKDDFLKDIAAAAVDPKPAASLAPAKLRHTAAMSH